MPVVVCFGDSNTWGYNASTSQRFPPSVRWTGVMADQLGDEFRIIEEGLNGRTTNLDDVIEEDRNGRKHLMSCLQSQMPFDLVTIMLGTNDLKARFERSASDIAQSAAALGILARLSSTGIDGASPEVLLIAPPPISVLTDFDEMFDGASAKSQAFARHYALFAQRAGVHFFDAGSVISSDPVDGIHFEAAEHGKLGQALASRVREILRC